MHVKYFEAVSVEQQMQKLKEIIKPKFELVDQYLKPLQEEGKCTYTKPTGGYFFSFNSSNNNADQIIKYCGDLGLKLLPVGACFPYQDDPDNRNIRLAPTFPDYATLERCLKIFTKVVNHLN
jgi:DNA-binding transcriptional MocR family regulator